MTRGNRAGDREAGHLDEGAKGKDRTEEMRARTAGQAERSFLLSPAEKMLLGGELESMPYNFFKHPLPV